MTRLLMIVCPTCGHEGRYSLELTEGAPQVRLLWCNGEEGGCEVPFAVEVRLRVEIDYSTCRLALPSTQRPDAGPDAAALLDGRRGGEDD